jgi:hypothetical protein
VTGTYGLAVHNFNELDFTPVTDSPLGTDIHGNTTATATLLTLNHAHARVSSNIDAAGDSDVFKIEAVDGKLVVEAGAAFPATFEVTDASGNVLGTLTTPERHALVLNVTAGTYYISVVAANATNTGAYRMNVVNAPIPTPPEDRPHDHPDRPTPEELFAKVDADDDAAISLAEFKAGVPGGRTRLADRVFANWDTTGDGSLSLEEFVAGLARLHLPGLHGSAPDQPPSAPIVTSN